MIFDFVGQNDTEKETIVITDRRPFDGRTVVYSCCPRCCVDYASDSVNVQINLHTVLHVLMLGASEYVFQQSKNYYLCILFTEA